MENIIELSNVSKRFSGFQLNDLSIQIKKGFVTGFIGANGAGKSTTIKIILNLMKPDSGDVKVFGLNFKDNEKEIKQRIGFVFDDNIFYDHINLVELKKIIASSYSKWDEEKFNRLIKKFELPLNKKIKTFSKGMQMKASLAFALSHHAELIIMDEPTSGLDPVFRRELLHILHEEMIDGDTTIFFSTHITSDLDRLADYITFIQDGELIMSKELDKIEEEYAIVKGRIELLDKDTESQFISIRKTSAGFEGLAANKKQIEKIFGSNVLIEKPTLEDIMYYTKRGVVDD